MVYYTFSEDVDLVIRPRREELDEADCTDILTFLDTLNDEQSSLKEHIEFDFFEHHDVTMNGVLPIDFQEIWDEALQIRFRGQEVFVMPPETMLVSACIASCRKRFFHLKSLCDIRELIDKYHDLDWKEVIEKSIRYQCSNIVYAALVVTNLTLGSELPSHVLDDLAVNPIRAKNMQFLAHGLYQSMSLSTPLPHAGKVMLDRSLNRWLILTYATYQWDQVGRKVEEIYTAWRRS